MKLLAALHVSDARLQRMTDRVLLKPDNSFLHTWGAVSMRSVKL